MQRFSVLEQLGSFTVNRDTEIMSCMSANQHTIAKLQSETAKTQTNRDVYCLIIHILRCKY